MPDAPALEKLGWTQVNLPDGSFRWVVAKTYRWTGSESDRSLIAALIGHPSFRDNYCAPGEESEVEDPVHGPYKLDAVSVEAFSATSSDVAAQLFDEWLRESDGEETTAREAAFIEEAVRPIRALLTSGDAWYHLPDLGESARHKWGWVLWHFREWIIIDRGQSRLHTVAAGLD